jgi:hypothetical protein
MRPRAGSGAGARRSRFAAVAKRTRWVQFEVPLFVRVEIDEEYEDDRVAQVVLAIGDPPCEGVELARDWRGHYLVYDGDPDAEMERVPADDALSRQAVSLAEHWGEWPAREDWEEGEDPRRMPGLYDEEPEEDRDEDLEWTPLH